jgi:hypothetical protein
LNMSLWLETVSLVSQWDFELRSFAGEYHFPFLFLISILLQDFALSLTWISLLGPWRGPQPLPHPALRPLGACCVHFAFESRFLGTRACAGLDRGLGVGVRPEGRGVGQLR